MGTGLFCWCPSENIGKSAFWWAFCWRGARKQIKKTYETNGKTVAQRELLAIIPETLGAESYIIKWLADRYNWKKAGK